VARPVGYRVPAHAVPEAVERLLRVYLAERHAGESFRAFCAARTDDELRTYLAGVPVAAVTRDASPAPSPWPRRLTSTTRTDKETRP